MRLLLSFALLPLANLTAQDVTFTIDAAHDGHTIPEAVYGANDLSLPGSTVHRHGGNRQTGFNWENNASNAGTDYINSSDSYLGNNSGIGDSQVSGALLQAWLNADRAQSRKTIITLPLAGYVAADMTGPVSAGETAPSARWKQVLVNKPGALSLTPDKSDGVVYLDEMVNFLVTKYGTAAEGGVSAYSLDNEPALWPSTHPRIHPNATGYEELVGRHTAAAKMATALDPSGEIYGPVLYGWNAHLNLQNAPDADGFNQTYGTFTNYYLAQMKKASQAAGRRLLHRFDMHWYPEAQGDNRIVFGSGPGTNNDIDARLEAPRSLWDASYVEKSWITQYTTDGKGIRLLPLLHDAVDQYYPGTGLALTEYNYGAADHISGGVAQADVLGVLGEYEVAGCFWPLIDDNSYVAAAFQLYRNYNNAGARFGTISLSATASDNSKAAIHAARTANGKLTVVAINRSRTDAQSASFHFTMPTGQAAGVVKAFRLSASGGAQVQPVPNPPQTNANSFTDSLPPMSVTLYEVQPAPDAAAQLYSIGNPTNDQQYMLELVNRARANADAEAIRLGLNGRQEGPPNYNGELWTIQNATQPLSWNPQLAEAAQNQSAALNSGDQFFSGTSPHTYGGKTPAQRIAAAGFQAAPYSGPTTQPTGYYPSEENVAEAVSQGGGAYTGGRLTAAVLEAHNGLFKDTNVPSRAHRSTMTAGFFRELGVGLTAGTDSYQGQTYDSFYAVEDFGTRVGSTPFITGVVSNDANGNGFYDPGEGVAGMRVDVPGAAYYAVTASSGGYSVPVPGNGNYTVQFSGGPLPDAQRTVTVANGANVKVDYKTSNPPPPVTLANISTRLGVETGDDVLIGGFIITGSQPKKLILRARGPSLPFPPADRLANPTLELIDKNGATVETNDDWQQSPEKPQIIDSGVAPTNDLESAMLRSLPPGAYTAAVRGAGGGTGIGSIEIYDLDRSTDSQLANISTRGVVGTGDNALIAGTIVVGQKSQKVIVRAIGPSLSVPGKLANPTLELRDSNGGVMAVNDDWRTDQQAEIIATQIPPSDDRESAIVRSLPPASYTAIVRGAGGATGVGVVEVYALSD